ncbi:Nif3-like dinuclear metal center hexameric protein [Eggerthellaceae bacterium zg-887]|uniref:Nif3-like dinuclear metal center hexameric protein n=1 Tax=Xiamenia xianingshaonis TaxID=2682776 RepID=UPI001407579C|nr:Nif3-like dinuclear metal center hexameric protein [Xiamenia xianingshaonis]NHM16022.1 Nif3-like dinuclear metal center hexameric protein [Xiamenia xianingshaonis]
MVAGERAEAYEKSEQLAKLSAGTLSRPAMALTVGFLERLLLSDFPACDAEPWDRTGLLVGDPARLVKRVAVALDPTVDAIDAAADAKAEVLLTHHPAFLDPPTSFSPAPSVALSSGAGVWRAIECGVALMNFHTALDVSPRAQRVLPGLLGLDFKGVVEPVGNGREKGYGQLCTFGDEAPLTLGQLAARCTAVFGRAPRVWGDFSRVMERVVTCTGSIGGVGRRALAEQADCVVCGEVKYHEALDLSLAGLCIVELGHDTSELPLTTVLASAVRAVGVAEDDVVVIGQGDRWACPEAVRV